MLFDWFLEDYPDWIDFALPASFWSWRLSSASPFCLLYNNRAAESSELKQQYAKKKETSVLINQNQIWLPLYNVHYCLNVDTVTISLETYSWFISV